uniref:Ribosomal protein L16 n=1 Tax=Calliarthron tuberculosum TaxID=48942 RepID=A0A0F6Y5U1_CALTB|nr:ribosomal protein L16 [Calliarthron tuberculosum]AKG26257.1 ribosomal protein L16 [Calliarthron tuberculosum]
MWFKSMIILWIKIFINTPMIKKSHKNHIKTLTKTRHILRFGEYGFKIMSSVTFTKEQIESLNRNLLKKLKIVSINSKNYKFWTLLKTNKTLTKLSLESRMGKGKGSIYTEAVFLQAGSIIYEFMNLKNHQILELFAFFKKQIPRTEIRLINQNK